MPGAAVSQIISAEITATPRKPITVRQAIRRSASARSKAGTWCFRRLAREMEEQKRHQGLNAEDAHDKKTGDSRAQKMEGD